MPFDFIRFAEDFGVETVEEGDKHCTPGWVQTHCPSCEQYNNLHLGWSLEDSYFRCWACGPMPFMDILQGITGFQRQEIGELLPYYKRERKMPYNSSAELGVQHPSLVQLPSGTGHLGAPAKRYLRRRGYKPSTLAQQWGLKSTIGVGDYRCRIIAPIHHRGKLVSYQGRDYSDQARLRYKACRMEDEVRHHKHCLYGLDQAKGSKVIVVEGITDVWRLGPGAVATFGIIFTQEQVSLLKQFDGVFVLFDREPQAQKQAERMAHYMAALGKEVEVVQLEDCADPADLPAKEAKALVKELLS